MRACVTSPGDGVQILLVSPRKYIDVSQVMPVPPGKLYERLLARCKSPNDVNRVHIALGNRLTPAEMESICRSESGLVLRANAVAAWARRRFGASKVVDSSYAWKLGMLHLSDWSGGRASEPYRRRRLSQNMMLYSSGSESTTKSLVVCFTGYFHRMMTMIHSFLQSLPASRYDVLMLKDPRRRGYAEGIPGIPGGFEGLISTIGSFAHSASYASMVSFGVSYGGLPGLVLATRLGFDKAVSVGGIGRDPRQHATAEMARILDGSQHSGPSLLLVYASDSNADRNAAFSFGDLASVSLLGVRSRTQEKIGHNPIHFLHHKGMLPAFLEKALDPSTRGFSSPSGETMCVLEI